MVCFFVWIIGSSLFRFFLSGYLIYDVDINIFFALSFYLLSKARIGVSLKCSNLDRYSENRVQCPTLALGFQVQRILSRTIVQNCWICKMLFIYSLFRSFCVGRYREWMLYEIEINVLLRILGLLVLNCGHLDDIICLMLPFDRILYSFTENWQGTNGHKYGLLQPCYINIGTKSWWS